MKKNNKKLDKWCIDHDLEIKQMVCHKCSECLVANIPVTFSDGSVGLKCSPCHTCGNKNTPFTISIADPEICEALDRLTNSSDQKETIKII